MYLLTVSNDSGASETTKHPSKASVRRQIRTWQRGMWAFVQTRDGHTIYEGSAYSFR